MADINLYDLEGKVVGKVPVPAVLEGAVHEAVLWQAVRMYRANQRQGTAQTKTRGQVSGGGRKPWKQKHTGRARAGSIRSPIWRKGGIVFGPHPREHRYELPEKIRRMALVSSLRDKVGSQAMVVVQGLEGLEPKTKALAGLLRRLKADGGTLLVVDRPSAALARAARNLPKVEVKPAAEINCYDVLVRSKVILTADALKVLEAQMQAAGGEKRE